VSPLAVTGKKMTICKRIADVIIDLYSKKKIRTEIEVCEFEKIYDSLLEIEKGHVRGKLVARVSK